MFGDCGDLVDLATVPLRAERAGSTFECGVLEVPLDHDSPDGEQLGIEVVRIRDDRQVDRIGSLVMNPGGPGISGLGHAPYWASWLPEEISGGSTWSRSTRGASAPRVGSTARPSPRTTSRRSSLTCSPSPAMPSRST